ncbi:MAG: hypothetical protein ACYDCQ_06570 [Dehalococcoidia bacterium]
MQQGHQQHRPAMVSLHGLERTLRSRLRAVGRGDVAEQALAGLRFTDDGTTRYVHVFMREDWPHYRAGDAYPLAFAEYPDLGSLADWRMFLREAGLLLDDDFERLVQWFDGR